MENSQNNLPQKYVAGNYIQDVKKTTFEYKYANYFGIFIHDVKKLHQKYKINASSLVNFIHDVKKLHLNTK